MSEPTYKPNNVVHVSFLPVPPATTPVDPNVEKDIAMKQAALDKFDQLPANEGEDDKQWAAGVAVCMGCRHEWPAVVPLGTSDFECPSCFAKKGHMKYQILRDESEWTCACGNDLFRVTPSHIYCPNCGTIPELPPA